MYCLKQNIQNYFTLFIYTFVHNLISNLCCKSNLLNMKRNAVETVLPKPIKWHHKLSEDVLLPVEGRAVHTV